MSQHRLLITDHPWTGLEIENRILGPYGVKIVDAPDANEETLVRLAADVDAIATCWGQVTGKVIRAARDCRIVCRMGIGLDNIDIPTATSLGIPVTNVPDYCVEEVAEHALGLMLALVRNVAFFHLRTKRGEYDLKAGPAMNRLRGRRLGLIGFGRIARAVRERALPFGLEVVASTASGNDHGTGCPMIPLEELLGTSDLISLHAPLSDATQHLLGTEAFAKMKPGVILVNTSRGGLIDPRALHEAIEGGIVRGAGLDVFEPEPPDLADPLYEHESVIVTPHAAFVSVESVNDLRQRVAEQIVAILNGDVPENVVNPEVLTG
jgi:D-3-phosphoglycerate dehydrogenase / 2-oxoglutarate reductase